MGFATTRHFAPLMALVLACGTQCLAARFDQVNLDLEVSPNGLSSLVENQSITGIVIKSDSEIRLYTSEFSEGLDGVFVNDIPLAELIREEAKNLMRTSRFGNLTIIQPEHSENPLWGKKMTIVGDSEAAGSTSYGNIIGARNGMTVVNRAIGGTALVGTKESNALFPNYRDWISSDSDYILVQIGCNDGSTWNPNDDDDSTNTNVFKGAWNVFLQNLKSEYPNAKKAIIMPYYWNTSSGRDTRVAWMKTRCDKYSLEYVDGVVELGFAPTTQPQYFQENEDHTPNQYHFTALGHQRASYVYENFKTRVQFSK